MWFKAIIAVLLLVLYGCSCSWGPDIEGFDAGMTRADEYYWLYSPDMFYRADSCYVVGVLENQYMTISINHRCKVYNDTIYVIKKKIAGQNRIFNGMIYTKEHQFQIRTLLN